MLKFIYLFFLLKFKIKYVYCKDLYTHKHIYICTHIIDTYSPFQAKTELLLLYCCLVVSNSFTTPWAAAHQAPLSMGFSGKNTGGGCHFLLQQIFLTQRPNLRLLHWQTDSLLLSHWGAFQVVSNCSAS